MVGSGVGRWSMVDRRGILVSCMPRLLLLLCLLTVDVIIWCEFRERLTVRPEMSRRLTVRKLACSQRHLEVVCRQPSPLVLQDEVGV